MSGHYYFVEKLKIVEKNGVNKILLFRHLKNLNNLNSKLKNLKLKFYLLLKKVFPKIENFQN